MIICDNICKSFNTQRVLDLFSCRFNDTGFYLLFGESGSGKTTFLNILAGFLPFDSGIITLNGKSFENQVTHDGAENGFDYITQDSYFADFLSVIDNMRLVCESDEKILNTLDLFGLREKTAQTPATLSGGEKQRLAIARALLGGKKVLLLDEPTASLDKANKISVFELLSKLKKDMLIICSSHDSAARSYADEVIAFTKNDRRAPKEQQGQMTPNVKTKKKSDSQSSKKNPERFLIKWFSSKSRSRRASVLFALFLVLSSCLCLLADQPSHKLDTSMEYMYDLNLLTISTKGKTHLKSVAPLDERVKDVVLDYNGSLPDGNEDLPNDVIMRPTPGYELSLNVIPFNKDSFKLSDKIKYGSYFTDTNQVILSYEMASGLYPSDPGKLVGEHLTKNIYGLGNVDFEVIGIFDIFNDAEKFYLNSINQNTMQTGSEYNPNNYRNLYFVNSRLTDNFEDDENFYMAKEIREYCLYFDSFEQMKSYYDDYYKELEGNESVLSVNYASANMELTDLFTMLYAVLLPTSVFMVLFAALFYIAIKKTEFEYNSSFISVFEYSGYSKKKVINRFIVLNILDLLKILVISEGAAFAITFTVNMLNKKFLFVPFERFTYNIFHILAYNVLLITVSLAAIMLLFKRVRVLSWYENLVSNRDLI